LIDTHHSTPLGSGVVGVGVPVPLAGDALPEGVREPDAGEWDRVPVELAVPERLAVPLADTREADADSVVEPVTTAWVPEAVCDREPVLEADGVSEPEPGLGLGLGLGDRVPEFDAVPLPEDVPLEEGVTVPDCDGDACSRRATPSKGGTSSTAPELPPLLSAFM
jgi:hypothetical protein